MKKFIVCNSTEQYHNFLKFKRSQGSDEFNPYDVFIDLDINKSWESVLINKRQGIDAEIIDIRNLEDEFYPSTKLSEIKYTMVLDTYAKELIKERRG